MAGNRKRRGAAIIEHVMVLALIVSCVLICAEVVAPMFHTVNKATDSLAARPSTGGSPSVVGQVSEAPQTVPTIVVTPPAPGMLVFALASTTLMLSLLRTFRDHGPTDEELEAVKERGERVSIQRRIFSKRQQILKVLNADTNRLMHHGLTAGHLMSDKVVSVPPNMTSDEVRHMMKNRGFHHLLVADARQNLLGIISDRDLLKTHAHSAAELMTANPLTINYDSPIDPAITLMIHRRISCLPVLDNGVLKGVLTTTDLIMALQCTLAVLEQIASHLKDGATEG